MHIFLVDDEADIINLTTAFLKRYGHQVSSCSTLAEAKKAIKANAFDAYLIDVHLPDGTGFELTDAIKRNDDDDPAIILMSAYDDVEAKLPEYPIVQKFIKKPFRPVEVLNAIDEA